MYVFCVSFWMHTWAFIHVCVRDRKAENDSEWRTNPFGHIAESNTKYQNLIISIIIFIIFIHFLPARLNAFSLFPSLSLTHSSFFCTLIYFFPPLLSPLATCEPASHVDWQHSSGLRKSSSFFLSLFFPFWSDVVLVMPGPYQETQFIAVSLGKRGCHSHWLTALRFAGCSVGISFKLLCFSNFFSLQTCTRTGGDYSTAHGTCVCTQFTHIHKDVADRSAALPRHQTVLFFLWPSWWF